MKNFGNNTLLLIFDEAWNENITSSRILSLLSFLYRIDELLSSEHWDRGPTSIKIILGN